MFDHETSDVVAMLIRYRPGDDHFDDEWAPALRTDVLTDILTSTQPPRMKHLGPAGGRRWARIAALAAGAAVAAATAAVVLPAGSPGGPDQAAAATFEKLVVVARQEGGSVAPSQFAYVQQDSEQTVAAGEPIEPGATRVGHLQRTSSEQWTAPNGTVWLYRALGRDRSCLRQYPHHSPPVGVYDYENLSAAELAALPTDPDRLASYLDSHPSGDNRGAHNRFLIAGDLLRSGLASPALRSATLRMLAQSSGIQVTPDSRDDAGRPAVRVDMPFQYGAESLFFDAATSRVLEEQTTQDQYLFRSVVRESKIVQSVPGDLPACPKPTTEPG
jgi:hypothetical protein